MFSRDEQVVVEQKQRSTKKQLETQKAAEDSKREKWYKIKAKLTHDSSDICAHCCYFYGDSKYTLEDSWVQHGGCKKLAAFRSHLNEKKILLP